jgi:hypothetical protein
MTEKVESWWPSLHDAELIAFSSDRSARSVTLNIKINNLADASGIGADFSIALHVVRAVNVTKWESWTFPERPASDPELMGRRDWGRMTSIDALDFKGPNLRVHDATVRTSTASNLAWPLVNCPPETVVQLLTLDVDGAGSETGDVALAVVFEAIQVFRGGHALTVEELVALGRTYWAEWQRRNEHGKA